MFVYAPLRVNGEGLRKVAVADAFKPLPGRDAYAAIRGFVYQVQRTILAWLALPPDAALLCEAGEDIDHLRGVLSGDGTRLLEQVKFREERLSLHSPEILEALGNFLIARERNPHHDLRFRLFTNAKAMTERSHGFPGGIAGIDAWNAISTETMAADERAATLTALRAVLSNAVAAGAGRRHPTQAAAVSRFLDDANDATLAGELVDRVEFALGNAGVEDLRAMVEDELRARGITHDAAETGQLYLALFVHVFHLLGRPGEKRLDPPTLTQLAEAGTLAAVDRATLDRIEGYLADATAQMASMQEHLAIIQHHTSPEQIEATVVSALQNTGVLGASSASLDGLKRRLVVGVPPLATPLVGREVQLAALRERLITDAGVTRIALQGLPGAGKSSLAVALCHDPVLLDHFTGGILWARLGPRADAASTLSSWATALGVDLAGVQGLSERAQRLSRHIRAAVEDRPLLLVLDDIWRREDLAPFLALTMPRMAIVLTSRDRQLAREFQRSAPVIVSELAQDEALALLAQYCPEAEAIDPGVLRELAQAAGGLPLALVLIGAELAAHADQRRWLSAAVTRLKAAQERLALAEAAVRPGMDGLPLTLQAVVELSVEALPEAGDQAAFFDLAVFGPKPADFSREAALAVWNVTDAEGDVRLQTLTRHGLLEIAGEDRFTLHQVLAAVAASHQSDNMVSAARHFAFFLIVARNDPGRWAAIESEWPQIRQAWAWAEGTPSQDLPILLLTDATREYMVRRGLVAEAIEWHNRASRQRVP